MATIHLKQRAGANRIDINNLYTDFSEYMANGCIISLNEGWTAVVYDAIYAIVQRIETNESDDLEYEIVFQIKAIKTRKENIEITYDLLSKARQLDGAMASTSNNVILEDARVAMEDYIAGVLDMAYLTAMRTCSYCGQTGDTVRAGYITNSAALVSCESCRSRLPRWTNRDDV